jgi:hypothetical protein
MDTRVNLGPQDRRAELVRLDRVVTVGLLDFRVPRAL